MTDSINEKIPKLREGLDILRQIESKANSLESRLSILSTNLIGSSEKSTEEMIHESKTDSDDVDRLGKVVYQSRQILKILNLAEESLLGIEREI